MEEVMSKHRHSAEQIAIKLRYARDVVAQQDIHLSKLECYKRQIIIGLPFSSTLLTGLRPFEVCQHQLLPRADRT
jgi:hypothetical protein